MPIIAGVDVPNWCVAGAAALTPAAVYAYLLRTSQQRQLYFAEIPQPKEESAILGGLANMAELNDPLKSIPMMQQLFKRLGSTWGIRLPSWLFPKNEMFLVTADPAIVAEIQAKKDIFHSRVTGFGFDNTIPLGLLALRSEGPQSHWALHRRLIAPLFSDKFLAGYSEQVQEKADLMRYILNERIKATKGAETQCDVQECLKLVTLDIIGSIGFGFNSKSLMTSLPQGHPEALSKAEAKNELQFLDAANVLLYETQQRSGEPWIFPYFPLRFMRWQKAKGVMNKRINDVLTSGRQEGAQLNMLKALQNAHEGGKTMSKAELTDEVLTLLMAGHETTGYTTSWALFEVAKHSEVQEKIVAETSAVDLDTLLLTKVQNLLPYTWMVWQEALRLHPTVTYFERQAEVDTTLGGKFKLPAGSVVNVYQMGLAHSEEIWGPDVMSFSPERMEKGYPEMHLPFGFGGRACIGKRLAYVEGVYLLAFIVKSFKLRVGEGSPAPIPKLTITHHAEDGIHLLMSRRWN